MDVFEIKHEKRILDYTDFQYQMLLLKNHKKINTIQNFECFTNVGFKPSSVYLRACRLDLSTIVFLKATEKKEYFIL